MTAPISEVSEALKLLTELVKRGEKVQVGVTGGPWIVDSCRTDTGLTYQHILAAGGSNPDIGSGVAETYHNEAVEIARDGTNDGKACTIPPTRGIPENAYFIRASRSLVPAMVKGARAVLDIAERLDRIDTGSISGQIIIGQANAYREAMAELGWMPK